MKTAWILILSLLVSLPVAFSATPFDQLKSLAGEWISQGNYPIASGTKYELISGGTALMETLQLADGQEMVSVYYQDGGNILMTHFCPANNQPRLKAIGSAPDTIVFQFVDATNLEDLRREHIAGLVLHWQDADHMTQEWTHRVKGEDRKEHFQFSRKQESPSTGTTPFCTQHVHSASSLIHVMSRSHQMDSECTRSAIERGEKSVHKNQCTCRKCDCK